MKLYIIFLFCFYSLSVMGSEALSEETCLLQAESYGNGQGIDEIEEKCLELFKRKSLPALRFASAEDKISGFGYKNVIVVSTAGKTRFYAGSSTRLKDLKHLKYDSKQKEIYAVVSSGEVLTFSLEMIGNVGPKRLLIHPSISQASNFLLDPLNKQFIIVDADQSNLYFFDKDESFYKGSSMRPINRIEMPISKSNLKVVQVSEKLFVSDQSECFELEASDRKNFRQVASTTCP